MQIGIHLPHAGEQATPALIRRHAIRAEALGLADIWVSEHIIVPRATFPRSPIFFDPVVTLSWVAAVTERIRLGTSVLVLPMRHPLPLAKELATLQNLSNGRFILGAGVGWLEAEFAALGVPFNERGRRMDEGIALMRAAWNDDPVSFPARWIPAVVDNMRMMPKPEKPIPIWIGGTSDAALKRAARHDGWHGSRANPQQAVPLVARLRAERPDRDFVLSLRAAWDGKSEDELQSRLEGFAAIGIDHVMVEPFDRELEEWLRSVERVAAAGKEFMV
jgi:probable F420-dependent oxidoreductase